MILHIDMDAFFAAVEQRDNPELRGKPVIISGRSMRSVVSTASYEARVFGVKSAMPLATALKLCPDAVVVRGRMDRYRDVSGRVFRILRNMSPLVEPVSIDEAYVDVSGCERLLGSPFHIAGTIKHEILNQENLTCSIGIAPVKFAAKIASDMNKPDGITVITQENMPAFIETLPIGKVPGVGAAALKTMASLGIKTLGQIRALDDGILKSKFGVFGARLKHLSLGHDAAKVVTEYERRSYSTETTLDEDTLDSEFLARILLEQAGEVARQLRKGGVKARIVTLKITYADFRQITRRRTLDYPAQNSEQIFEEALRLFKEETFYGKIRLIGVGAAGLLDESRPVQASLFTDTAVVRHEKWEKAERTLDSIMNKFESIRISRATTAELGETPVKGKS